MDQLKPLLGVESPLTEVTRALYSMARSVQAPVVGAMQVTCADEAEFECQKAFMDGFAQHLLPHVKFVQPSPFLLSTLGARYEWGAVRVAEEHFATRESESAFKFLAVKVNAHAGLEEVRDTLRYGHMDRYGSSSASCGALAALLGGSDLPAIQVLRRQFTADGVDRVGQLLDEKKTPPDVRALYAAIVQAQLQSRAVFLDIQEHEPHSPTFYVVVSCVTINRKDHDTEILCGAHLVDHRTEEKREDYAGLGDEPATYRIKQELRRVRLTDENPNASMPPRNVRRRVLEEWQKHGHVAPVQDPRLDQIRADVAAKKHHQPAAAHSILRSLLPLLAQISPIPAAIYLFANGMAGIHHITRAQSLARAAGSPDDARHIIGEVQGGIESLKPAKMRAMIETLLGGGKGRTV
ncbi:MAG: hypothetical protein JXP34_24495 [Planctomycetes bacterium]|nr:hypothetical protein [Planctomycetota bacterium]